MNIAICDDKITELKETSATVKNVLSDIKIKYSIDEFTDADKLLEGKQYDLVFLDIELKNPEKNGVLIAQQLKRVNPDCIIIFVTKHEEYIDDVIGKYAFRYWSKPIEDHRLRKSLATILERMETITVETYYNKQNIELPLRNVIYITPEDKHCRIVTIYDEYIVTESFKKIREKIMLKNFCNCHGSYCVNLNFVEKYTKSSVYLRYKENQYQVYMSRRQYKTFKDQIFILGGEQV
ncbi:MAG: response regulator transcription factor [Oscillospiraceae bacterium]|nr:response regulator transcription factor [Oscillospiraceae bacterium]